MIIVSVNMCKHSQLGSEPLRVWRLGVTLEFRWCFTRPRPGIVKHSIGLPVHWLGGNLSSCGEELFKTGGPTQTTQKELYKKKYTIYPTIYLIILSLLDLEIIWFGVGRAPQKRAILISRRKLIQAPWEMT